MFKEEEVIWITVVGTSIALFLSVTLFIFFISYQKRKFKYTKEKQQLRTDFQQELLRAQLEIQEQTFQNISQEIHDNIGQMLSLAKLNLNTTDISQPKIAEDKIQRSKDLVSKAISDLRDLSKSLNPDIIMKIGLSEAIQRELLLVAKAGQFEVNLTQNGDLFRFDPQKELIVFRIFQEILNNIITHSKAKTVDVNLDFQPHRFSLTVADDGEGFDVEKLDCEETNLGLGVRNMKNRAILIGANFTLNSILGKGTKAAVDLPV
ncbi:MAG TPA: sensor histidine kinase [Chitinophagaceae bacterium]|nr:sensor histidine kinase [Chitinophagaceae bacterium]